MSFMRMRNAVTHLIPKVYNHPVNEALFDGTLPWHVFRFYLEQDYLYLHDFSKALMLVSNKLASDKHANSFKIFSEEALDTQRNLHLKYLGEPRSLRLFSSRQFSEKKIPIISDYTTDLITTANDSPTEEAVAGLIPCFWLYNAVGKKMLNSPGYNIHNPYHLWIMSYSSEQFTSSTKLIIQIADELANATSCPIRKKNMVAAFVKSTKYEILFLDSVYKKMDISNKPIAQNRFAHG